MSSLRFSGHESFQCRNLWLKKGYDFITRPKKYESAGDFNNDLAVIDLGVGKNMVSSIRFWMKAFDLVDEEEQPTSLAEFLFGLEGRDPFLEDTGTLWLLHYKLVKASKASIYHLVFNRFRKQRIEFRKSHLKNFLINECDRLNETHSPNTIDKDVGIFLKSYVAPEPGQNKDYIEDHYASLLIDLNLVKKIENYGTGETEWYKIESSDRDRLPLEIYFYVILDNIEQMGQSISLHKLMNSDNSPGNIFALTPDALVAKIHELVRNYDGVVYKEDAGIRELQINKEFNKEEILDQYYGRN
jgi:hypothetical protein